ncbi:MAG: hypothetical protein WBB45_00640 [Cyclobacteriaceae bacterium]
MKKILLAIALLGMMTTLSFGINATDKAEIAEATFAANEIRGQYIGYNAGQYSFMDLTTSTVQSVYGGGTTYNFTVGNCYIVNYYVNCDVDNYPGVCEDTITSYKRTSCY